MPFGEALLGHRIAVDRDEGAARSESLGEQAGVTAAPEGAVDHRVAGLRVQQPDELSRENRNVDGGHVKQDGQLGR